MKDKILPISIMGIIIILQIACSPNNLKGTWQYDGGIYDGKSRTASPDFKMQRTYNSNGYEAFMIEGEEQPDKYAAGKYEIKNDSLYLTSEYSSQPSQVIGKTIIYKFKIDNSKLTINGVLPNGMVVEEYWKRIK